MARGQQSRNRALLPQAAAALDQFKYEVASELGINRQYQTGYWGDISARECGAVGGHMVRRMIAAAEQALLEQAAGAAGTAQFGRQALAQAGGQQALYQAQQAYQAQQGVPLQV